MTDIYALPECLTCNDTIKLAHTEPSENSVPLGSSENCLFYSASFSQGGDFYALECLGDRIPITFIKSVDDRTLERKKTKKIDRFRFIYLVIYGSMIICLDVFEKNDELRHLIETRILPRKSYLRVFLDNNTGACKNPYYVINNYEIVNVTQIKTRTPRSSIQRGSSHHQILAHRFCSTCKSRSV